MGNNLMDLARQFRHRKILVIGDAMLDKYLSGSAGRICREAPVPIVDIDNEVYFPGGAANAAVNIARLGGKAIFLSAIGKDGEGQILTRLLIDQGVEVKNAADNENRKTLVKQRVSAGGQILVRFDYGSTEKIAEKTKAEVLEALNFWYPEADGVIVSDYGYGLMTPEVINAVTELQQKHHKMLLVDSKYLDRYSWVRPTVVKPNYSEILSLLGISLQESKGKRVEQIMSFAPQILKLTGADIVAATMDVEGSVVFEKGRTPYRTYAEPLADSKAAGAGDTFAAAFALALVCGANTAEAAELAAAGAGIVVQKEGTATCSLEELQFFFSSRHKFLEDVNQAELLARQYKAAGKKVIFTNGCFDILHSGHVQYLNSAKSLGDVLFVALNSDASIKRLKGKNRPINTLTDRVAVLSGLSSVDHLVSFKEDVPISIIKKIRPDIYVKGGDYTKDKLPEAAIVETLGGVVKIVPYINGHSTTSIIKQIQGNPRQNSQYPISNT